MNKEYENYYEDGRDPEAETEVKKPKRRLGRIVLGILAIAGTLSVIVFLFAGVVRSMHKSIAPLLPEKDLKLPDFSEYFEEQPDPAPTPRPTPLASPRPMPALDGVSPLIIDQVNPVPDIAESVGESVVGVTRYSSESAEDAAVPEGTGSGFIISSDGYILTNSHVVAGAGSVTITLLGGEVVDAELIGYDEAQDVAVIKIDRTGLKALKLGDSDAIRVGEYVVTVGTPILSSLEGSVTMGIISARARDLYLEGDEGSRTYIQTDAAINFGSSGGPLLNMRGEVIGITTAKAITAGYTEYGQMIGAEGLSFALPINDVMNVVPQLITNGYRVRPALGVTVTSLQKNEAAELGLQGGALVHQLVSGGPAEQAGLKQGDIITACDGEAISANQTLVRLIDKHVVGDTLNLSVYRDGETIQIPVKLYDRDALDFDDALAMPEDEE